MFSSMLDFAAESWKIGMRPNKRKVSDMNGWLCEGNTACAVVFCARNLSFGLHKHALKILNACFHPTPIIGIPDSIHFQHTQRCGIQDGFLRPFRFFVRKTEIAVRFTKKAEVG